MTPQAPPVAALRQLRELLAARATLAWLPLAAADLLRACCDALIADRATPPRVMPSARAVRDALAGGPRCQTCDVDTLLTYFSTRRAA